MPGAYKVMFIVHKLHLYFIFYFLRYYGPDMREIDRNDNRLS